MRDQPPTPGTGSLPGRGLVASDAGQHLPTTVGTGGFSKPGIGGGRGRCALRACSGYTCGHDPHKSPQKCSRRVHGGTVDLGQTARTCPAGCGALRKLSTNTGSHLAPERPGPGLQEPSEQGERERGWQPVPRGPAEAPAGQGTSGEAWGSAGSSLGDDARWGRRQAGGRERKHHAQDGEQQQRQMWTRHAEVTETGKQPGLGLRDRRTKRSRCPQEMSRGEGSRTAIGRCNLDRERRPPRRTGRHRERELPRTMMGELVPFWKSFGTADV